MLYVENCPKGNHHHVQSHYSYYVIIDGLDRHWLQVSKDFAEILGYTAEELVGKSAQQMITQSRYDPAGFDDLLENESRELAFVFRHKSGKEVLIMASLKVLEDGCILGIARPVL